MATRSEYEQAVRQAMREHFIVVGQNLLEGFISDIQGANTRAEAVAALRLRKQNLLALLPDDYPNITAE